MASLTAVRDGLKARIETITGVTGYARAVGEVNVPAVVVTPGQIVFDDAMQRGSDLLTFTLVLLVTLGDSDLAQQQLDEYLAGSGDRSIKAAVEGDQTLGGVADWTDVKGVQAYGLIEYAGRQYVGARFPVEVNVDGT
ncbi:hypothetical protein [Lysinibacillus fusiformis]|uniref:hypothetical protein n=1 Tax=Lysinibacillus fusiformis TaxID=28031 RepID=UPI003D03352D